MGKFTDKEVQVVIIGTGVGDLSASFKLSYKGEMSQDMDQASTEAQIAEEINGFSALSGPVTVADEGNSKFKVTFNALDGDVAQLEAHTTSGQTVSVVTRENGWSIEGPIGANLDTMQAGGTINVTAKEVCSFTVDDADGSEEYYFCYDGVCGGLLTGTMATNLVNTYITTKIVDDNNVAILGTAAATYASGDKDANPAVPDVFAITLPLGKSCDGLEMRVKTLGNTGKIVKSVNKHNNGKVFKITRSFVQVEEAAPGAPTADGKFTFTDGKGHSALARASTIVVSDASSCPAKASTDYAFPFNRVVTGFDTGKEHGGAAAVVTHASLGQSVADFSTLATSACTYSLRRYVITLDSMPTASAHTATKTLLYKSPVGSCNVAETTKGTFESYECSNRGACDGKSGLCACYEGYSGESCQTQTVLV